MNQYYYYENEPLNGEDRDRAENKIIEVIALQGNSRISSEKSSKNYHLVPSHSERLGENSPHKKGVSGQGKTGENTYARAYIIIN